MISTINIIGWVDMSEQEEISFYDGNPFATSIIAIWCRDLLSKETGRHYQVIQDPHGQGFYVQSTASEINPDETIKINETGFQTLCYRQALRSWILSIPWLIGGVLIITYPAAIWIMLFQLLQVNALPMWFSTSLVVGATTGIGFAVIGYILLKIVWAYYSDRLNVTADGIDRHKGILSRTTTSLRFSDIRSITTSQSVFQRLLGVGMLEFSSAGSDGVDIRFDNLLKPFIIKERIQHHCRDGV